MKFTKEEISLCKQVAEKHRKDISCGDWYISIDDKPYLWESSSPFNKEFVDTCEPQNQANKIIPLWTISDCLEFLRAKPDLHTIEIIGVFSLPQWHVCLNWTDIKDGGKTPLEACLKAVLAVLEEKK